MKSKVILIFSCFFTVFLATTTQASDFTGNTCHEEGANCQTHYDWTKGWCEAASAAGVINETVEECARSGLPGNTCHEEGANCQTRYDWTNGWCEAAFAAGTIDQTVDECVQSAGANDPQIQGVPAQNQNAHSNTSSSGQGNGGGQPGLSGTSGAQGSSAISGAQGDLGPAISGAQADLGPGRGEAQWERCQSYRVTRSDSSRLVCVRPSPSSDSVPDYEGTNFDPFALIPG